MPCLKEEYEFLKDFLGVDGEISVDLVVSRTPECPFCGVNMGILFSTICCTQYENDLSMIKSDAMESSDKGMFLANGKKRVMAFYCRCSDYDMWVQKLNLNLINGINYETLEK